MSVYDVVEGQTSDIDFQLLENGAAIDLTGISVALLLEDRNGSAVPAPGTISIWDASNGKVRLTPTNATVFVPSAGPYFARWQLTDSLGKISYVPSSIRDTWNIIGK